MQPTRQRSSQTGKAGTTVAVLTAGLILGISTAATAAVGTPTVTYNLFSSDSSIRLNSQLLSSDAITHNENRYIYVYPTDNIAKVEYYLDGIAYQTEYYRPYDFSGTVKGVASPFFTGDLSPGTHNITAELFLKNGTVITLQEEILETQIRLSYDTSRSMDMNLLDKKFTQNEQIYLFAEPATNIKRVSFFMDSSFVKTEYIIPFDFSGTRANGGAKPLHTNLLRVGPHSVTAAVEFNDGLISVITDDIEIVSTTNLNSSSPSGSSSTSGSGATLPTLPGLSTNPVALVANPDNISTRENTPFLVNVTANDAGVGDTPITLSIASQPTNGVAVVADGSQFVYFRPDFGYSGPDSFVYKIQDINNTSRSMATVSAKVICKTNCTPDTLITLSWLPNAENVLGYEIYFGPDAVTTPDIASVVTMNTAGFNPLSPTAKFTSSGLGLTNGNQFCFRLKAYNSFGSSDFSGAVCSSLSL
ncbi:MAG: Ig-like domain-containing protein [Gammaproteobacteria bacterium]